MPFAGDVAAVLDRQRDVLELATGHPRVAGWVTLVGHDLMSDELVGAASRLAVEAGTNLTFHLSPTDSDATAYLARTGRRPVVHLDGLGVLGRHVLVAHGVHVDDAELDMLLRTGTALAYCPWAYLRLGQGVTRAGRHADFVERGGRLALGCDAENAGDAVDVLRAAALAAGLARDSGAAPIASAPTPPSSWPRSPAPRRSGWPTRSARWRSASAPTSSWSTRPVRRGSQPAADPVLGLIWGAGSSSGQ